MIVYIIILVSLLLGLKLSIPQKQKGSRVYIPQKQKTLFGVIIVFMFFLVALRDSNVGTDTLNYIRFYLSGDSEVRYGFLYDGFRAIASLMGDNANCFLGIVAFATFLPLFFILRKYSVNPVFSLLVFLISLSQFYLETFNLVRQSLSIVLVLYALCLINKKNIRATVLVLVVAFFAHNASCIVWPFFLILHKRIPILVVVGLIIFTLIVGTSDVITPLTSFLFSLQKFESISVFSAYADIDIDSELNVMGLLTRIIPISVLCLLLYPKRQDDVVLYNSFFYGVLIINVLLGMSLCIRLASSLTIVEILLVPQIYKNETNSIKKLLLRCFIGYEVVYFIFSIYSMQFMSFLNPPVPYHTCF